MPRVLIVSPFSISSICASSVTAYPRAGMGPGDPASPPALGSNRRRRVWARLLVTHRIRSEHHTQLERLVAAYWLVRASYELRMYNDRRERGAWMHNNVKLVLDALLARP